MGGRPCCTGRRDRPGAPVDVDNNANLEVLAEHIWRGAQHEADRGRRAGVAVPCLGNLLDSERTSIASELALPGELLLTAIARIGVSLWNP